ncbi:transcription factor MAMYB [Humulus lupulus]|uniref:transcription factor MAMYB n=1 Tax=Humulus lupulus TaxID=3486 RepID=UPI002B4040AB|nr:transcription factor MAMYB [Humulus lupulus]
MEFLDEDARPKFLFKARPQAAPSATEPETYPTNKLRNPIVLLTISLSFLLLLLSIFFLQSEPFKSLLLWVSLSFVLGPFAPASITGGDVSVGQGPVLDLPDESSQSDEETKRRVSQKRSKVRRSEEVAVDSVPEVANVNGSVRERKNKKNEDNGVVVSGGEEKEWGEEEIEVLKKQLLKNPVGKPRRWEVIAEAFSGRHKVESVIKKAKELGEKKSNDADSYSDFLKKRNKTADQRIELGSANEGGSNGGDLMEENGVVSWSSGEDIALLNALKAFPKEVSMRWEKIAAAVPGKSKAACMKRVTEFKKDFRSSKASSAVEN